MDAVSAVPSIVGTGLRGPAEPVPGAPPSLSSGASSYLGALPTAGVTTALRGSSEHICDQRGIECPPAELGAWREQPQEARPGDLRPLCRSMRRSRDWSGVGVHGQCVLPGAWPGLGFDGGQRSTPLPLYALPTLVSWPGDADRQLSPRQVRTPASSSLEPFTPPSLSKDAARSVPPPDTAAPTPCGRPSAPPSTAPALGLASAWDFQGLSRHTVPPEARRRRTAAKMGRERRLGSGFFSKKELTCREREQHLPTETP